jgi:hypothetical protein
MKKRVIEDKKLQKISFEKLMQRNGGEKREEETISFPFIICTKIAELSESIEIKNMICADSEAILKLNINPVSVKCD